MNKTALRYELQMQQNEDLEQKIVDSFYTELIEREASLKEIEFDYAASVLAAARLAVSREIKKCAISWNSDSAQDEMERRQLKRELQKSLRLENEPETSTKTREANAAKDRKTANAA